MLTTLSVRTPNLGFSSNRLMATGSSAIGFTGTGQSSYHSLIVAPAAIFSLTKSRVRTSRMETKSSHSVAGIRTNANKKAPARNIGINVSSTHFGSSDRMAATATIAGPSTCENLVVML